ncbi:MAG: tyrosine-type recombinase/integrase [bacterium]|nr:tyrosine-type recombinase/integrase [bacterium]
MSDQALRGARLFLAHLHDSGHLDLPDARGEPELPLVSGFQRWLRQHRGASESTVCNYSRAAAALLEALGADPRGFDATGLRRFILESARRSGSGAVKTLISGSRMFLRYLVSQEECSAGLERAIPAIACWRHAALPQSLPSEDVDRLLEACPGTPMGMRDRAMILLMARLGLRAGDVSGLRLQDIDWQDGSILVSGKSRIQARLPLPQEVGDAILAYLEHRPAAQAAEVFLRVVAPFRPLRSGGSVSQVVRRTMRRAGIESSSYGSHVLRHTAATEMLRQGASLYEIGSVLRHRSLDMTAQYAKIDVEALREVARPWPEEAPC